MSNKIIVTGVTTKKGIFGFNNILAIEDFCRKNPNCSLTITIEANKEKSRKAILSYYHTKILNDWQTELYQNGTIKSKGEVSEMLLRQCPITKDKSLSELSYDELCMFMDRIKEISLLEMGIVIEDVRNL